MMTFPIKIFQKKSNFAFFGWRKISYIVSMAFIVISILLSTLKGYNFGIDFMGGISIEVRTDKVPDLEKMRSVLGDLDLGEVVLQNFGSDKDLSIRVGSSNEEDLMLSIEKIKAALENNFDYEIEYRKVDFVGPQVGSQMIQSGTIAMILSFVAIMFYVWIRFEWQFGIGVVLALIHDVIIGLGFMSFMQLDFNLSTIAAILTVIGYSVNNSVVIYDRIRENLRKYNKKSIEIIIDLSVNETLSRTTITALTTLLANLALIILGGDAIRSFSSLVFVGILVGTYSSVCISAPILTLFNFRKFKE